MPRMCRSDNEDESVRCVILLHTKGLILDALCKSEREKSKVTYSFMPGTKYRYSFLSRKLTILTSWLRKNGQFAKKTDLH